MEYPAYLLGEQLGISVAKCKLDGDFVYIELFTNNEMSLVHAAGLKRYFDTDDEIYNEYVKMGRKDITAQIERIYIFNYLIGNLDIHDENTGVLYNAKALGFISLAPYYDHNYYLTGIIIRIANSPHAEASLRP